jgi:hypothetical protein
MAIIGTLPNNIQNGQVVDANPVMADFNYIVNQVNANANPLGTLTAPSGTVMPFAQATAPLGWTASTDAAHNDAAMRCMTPAGYGGTQGVSAFGLLLEGGAVTDGHSLSIGELAAHNHTDSGHIHNINDLGHSHGPSGGGSFYTTQASGVNYGGGGTSFTPVASTATVATGINILTGNAQIQNTGSGSAHTHTLTNFNYKIVDYILCTKS